MEVGGGGGGIGGVGSCERKGRGGGVSINLLRQKVHFDGKV